MNEQTSDYQQLVKQPALVMGANGFMGSHTVRSLVGDARQVRVMLRKSSNTDSIDGLPVERHYGDVADVDSMVKAMRGCGSVFYSVVDTRAWLSDPAPLYSCNVDGLINALEAAMNAGIKRFVFTSSMATIGKPAEGRASEEDAFNWWDTAPDYIKTRVLAENKLLQYCREKDFPGIALCVANTYGPQDYQPTPHGGLLWNAARGKLPKALDCAAPTVDIRDAAQAALLAERYGRPGERYIVANEYISQAEMYALATERFQRKPPGVLSIKMAYRLASLNEWMARLTGKKDFKLRRDSVLLSDIFGPMDNSKAVNELGWQPRPFKESINDALEWFSEHHYSRTQSSRQQ